MASKAVAESPPPSPASFPSGTLMMASFFNLAEAAAKRGTSRKAESAPARVAPGRTGVRGQALIPSRARNRLYRPGQPATIIDLDPCPAAIDHPYMLAGQLDPLRLHYAADTWPGKSRPRATCPLK